MAFKNARKTTERRCKITTVLDQPILPLSQPITANLVSQHNSLLKHLID